MATAAILLPARPTLPRLKIAAKECHACHLWRNATQTVFGAGALKADVAAIHPRALVCLGATAAQTLLGSSFRVSQQRGRFIDSPLAPLVTSTVHPSSVLRAPAETRRLAMREFIRDLTVLSARLRNG